MSDQITEKEIIEKLSNMREFIQKLCVEYNNDAKRIDMNSRIALIDASIYDYDDEDEDEELKKENKSWEEKAKSYDYTPSLHVDRCNAGAWFPSAFCR